MWRIWLTLVLFATYLIREVWQFFPASEAEYYMFPFSEQAISKQYYVYLVCQYFNWVLVFLVIYLLFDEARDLMIWFLAFQVLELIEFFLTYNEARFHIRLLNYPVGINITNIRAITMSILVPLKLYRWTR
jgi:hypothetical protein